jgi:hypothetical protein
MKFILPLLLLALGFLNPPLPKTWRRIWKRATASGN